MPGVAGDIVVPGIFRVYRAPKGTVFPVDESVALGAAFVDLGYTREDGQSFTRNREVTPLRAAQADHPVRHVVNQLGGAVAADLMQWNRDTWDATIGGTPVLLTPGHYKWTPKNAVDAGPAAWLLELIDGSVRFRICIPSAFPTEDTEIPMVKTEDSMLALRLAVEGGDGIVPWYKLGNSAAFAPAA